MKKIFLLLLLCLVLASCELPKVEALITDEIIGTYNPQGGYGLPLPLTITKIDESSYQGDATTVTFTIFDSGLIIPSDPSVNITYSNLSFTIDGIVYEKE